MCPSGADAVKTQLWPQSPVEGQSLPCGARASVCSLGAKFLRHVVLTHAVCFIYSQITCCPASMTLGHTINSPISLLSLFYLQMWRSLFVLGGSCFPQLHGSSVSQLQSRGPCHAGWQLTPVAQLIICAHPCSFYALNYWCNVQSPHSGLNNNTNVEISIYFWVYGLSYF